MGLSVLASEVASEFASVFIFFTLLSHKFQIPLPIGEPMPFCWSHLQEVTMVKATAGGDNGERNCRRWQWWVCSDGSLLRWWWRVLSCRRWWWQSVAFALTMMVLGYDDGSRLLWMDGILISKAIRNEIEGHWIRVEIAPTSDAVCFKIQTPNCFCKHLRPSCKHIRIAARSGITVRN